MTECGKQPAAGGFAARVGRVILNPPPATPFVTLSVRPARLRQQSAIRNRQSAIPAGFTLLEMLLALALIALLAGALIGGSSALLAEKPVSADDVFWATVQAARKAALNTQQDLNLRYDEKAKAFQLIGPDTAAIGAFPIANPPSDLAVEFLSTQRTGGLILLGGTVVETEPLTGGVTFYSDGTCTSFRLQIRANGGAHILAIDPWTCSPVITPPNTP